MIAAGRPRKGAVAPSHDEPAEITERREERQCLQQLGVFPTPPWATRAIIPQLRQYLPRKDSYLVLEPAAGDGAIVREVLPWCRGTVDCYEIRPECEPLLRAIGPCEGRVQLVSIRNFLELPSERRACDYDIAIGNPPYKHALEFVQHCMEFIHFDGIVVMLLRLGFLASQTRQAWLSRHMPDVHIFPRRPSFTGTGTDASDYGWFIFRKYERTAGVMRPLICKETS